MKLSVIIVNYNVRHFLEQALLSVRKAGRGIAMEVWVVDNNSVDDSVTMVQQKFPEVRLMANQHNPGFAVANNQAIRAAEGEYLLLLNPDTIVEEDTFNKCIAFMDTHPDAGGLGVRMIDGAGKFLPESKRGFPTPWAAFCKTFGLSRLFPNSPRFNRYHLGHLSEQETHRIDVLSGAFLFTRRSVLDEIGLLDETFFMYGEDIDLSYRIVRAGYHNYYLPETTIIHYKGESTKKGSLNYVLTFYNAMIIFARKHFRGNSAQGFVMMLQAAIYLRATISLLNRFFKRLYLPLLDAALIFGGLVFLKNFWAGYHFHDPAYYDDSVVYFNFPLYTLIWLSGIFFSGGYDRTAGLRQLVRGLLFGTITLAAVYGFLELSYRSSRALILLGTVWALTATICLRLLIHFFRHGNFRLDRQTVPRLVIVGSKEESKRVQEVLGQVGRQKNLVGTVAPGEEANHDTFYLSNQFQLDEVRRVYQVDEIIFCSRDVPAERIMYWMSRLGPKIRYKTVPEESLSIIGSPSRNTVGELYTVDIAFAIDQPAHRRNKRLLDIGLTLALLATTPIWWLFRPGETGHFFRELSQILLGKRSWVGYAGSEPNAPLPHLKPGKYTPVDRLSGLPLNPQTIRRLNFFYAKDYHPLIDLEIIWKAVTKKD